METIPILFCNRGCHNIISNRFKSDILKKIHNSFGISINDSNRIYSEKYSNNLYRYKHLVSYITGGSKYWLVLTNIKNINYAVFIQKKKVDSHKFPKMILCNYRFDDILYSNTIFDGELIKTYNNNWSFRVTDIPVYKNQLLKSKGLLDRIKILNYIFNKFYTFDENIQTCPLIISKFYSYSDLDKLIAEISNYNYKIIGISFRSIEKNTGIDFLFDKRNIDYNRVRVNYLENTDSYNSSLENIKILMKDSILENNENRVSIEKNTIKDKQFILRLSQYPGVYNLYNTDKNFNSIARIDSLETSAYLRNLCKSTKDITIWCKYDTVYQKWVPIVNN